MGVTRSYGASVDEVRVALRRVGPGWYRWSDLGLPYSYQSIGNALRHGRANGIFASKLDQGGSNRSVWSLRMWALA